jgi:hypothetical protein
MDYVHRASNPTVLCLLLGWFVNGAIMKYLWGYELMAGKDVPYQVITSLPPLTPVSMDLDYGSPTVSFGTYGEPFIE